jgi:hypothetical protein
MLLLTLLTALGATTCGGGPTGALFACGRAGSCLVDKELCDLGLVEDVCQPLPPPCGINADCSCLPPEYNCCGCSCAVAPGGGLVRSCP